MNERRRKTEKSDVTQKVTNDKVDVDPSTYSKYFLLLKGMTC